MVIEIFESSPEVIIITEIFDLNDIKQTSNRIIIANDNIQGEFEGWI